MQIKGQIESVAAITTRTEPEAILDLGQSVGGRVLDMNLTFKNTGNVNQTVTMNGLTDFLNVTLTVPGKFVLNGAIETPVANVAELAPGESGYYVFTIQLDEFPIGSPLQNYSLNADWSWS